MNKYQTAMNELLQDIIDEHRHNRDSQYHKMYMLMHTMRNGYMDELSIHTVLDAHRLIKESNAELDQILDTMMDGTPSDVLSLRTKRDAGVDTILDCLNNVIELVGYQPLNAGCRNIMSEFNIKIDTQLRYIRRTKENHDGLLDNRLNRCMQP
jgi:hypothetical protein